MRKIIRALAIVLLFAMGAGIPSIPALAKNSFGFEETFDILPVDWSQSVAKGEVLVEDGNLILSYDTENTQRVGRAEIASPYMSFEDEMIKISMQESFESPLNNAKRTLALSDSELGNLDILSMENDTVYIFGTAVNAELTIQENVIRDWTFYIDLHGDTVKAAAYLDNSNIYSADLGAWGLNNSALSLKIRNSMISAAQNTTGEWRIDRVSMTTGIPLQCESNFEDNAQLPVGGIETIELSYTGELDGALQEDSFVLYRDNAEIECLIYIDGGNVTIEPVDGLTIGTYTLMVSNVRDVLGNTAKSEYRFSVYPENYTEPQIVLSPNGTAVIKEGQKLILTASATTDLFKKTVFYVNNIEAYTAYGPQALFEFEKEQGIYEIYAVVYDTLMASAKSDMLRVEAAANDAPVIEVADSLKITTEEAKSVLVSAVDSDGIDRIELLSGGEIFDVIPSAAGTADLSNLGLGTIEVTVRAYDIYGKQSEKTFTVNIYVQAYNTVLTDSEFTYSISGTNLQFSSGITAYPRRGYIDSYTWDEVHGSSMRIGIDTPNEAYGISEYPYFTAPSSCDAMFNVNFDFYFSEKPSDTTQSKTKLEIFQNASGGASSLGTYLAQWGSEITVGGQAIEYEAGQWYNLNADIDIQGKTYTITITDASGAASSASGTLNDRFNLANTVRIYGPGIDEVKYYMLLDNLIIRKVAESPSVLGFSAEDSGVLSESIPADATFVKLHLSSTLYDFSADKVQLYMSGNEVALEKAGFDSSDNTVWIYPATPFASGAAYTVRLDESLQMLVGQPLGSPIYGSFTTSGVGDIRVVAMDFVNAGQGVQIHTSIENGTDLPDSVMLVATIWEDNRLIKTVFKKLSIEENAQTDDIFEVEQLLSSQSLEVNIWKDFADGAILETRQYVK
ncbi:Ig-like domain-containing protein [Ructibacterium gallinarum]|uniref:Ig-like domain-containing protein n=1 Tax=Ructibacterium gallinarum TaxID=2779355 RepID=A0A9D5M782_9FIRM|nr:hypothetical protein [Ructibacterium gallinarum]MBE5040802.1 hypothetical protein [Ructibacterium gallinarum]